MKKMTALPIAIAMLAMTMVVRAEPLFLETQTGNDIGLSLSSYNYHEPGYMSLQGAKAGLDLHVIRLSQGDDALIFRGKYDGAGHTATFSGTCGDGDQFVVRDALRQLRVFGPAASPDCRPWRRALPT